MTLGRGHSSELFQHGGRIVAVEGTAAEAGLQPGDELLAVDDQPVRDVIDVQFYAAEPEVSLLIRRQGELWLYELEREYGKPLGLSFENPTFDTDIRRCNNQCLFCFVTQMAPRGFRRSLTIKDDDYRYSFLDGNYVTLTNLGEDDWDRIVEQHLSPLYVSVHATDAHVRRTLLGNPAAPDIMMQLTRLTEAGIGVHTQLVIVPGWNDKEQLARSVEDLATLWPGVQTVSIVPVGLTRYHRYGLRTNSPAEAEVVLQAVDAWQQMFLDSLGERLVYATDEWYLLTGRAVPPMDHYPQLETLQENGVGLVRQFLDEWEDVKAELERSQPSTELRTEERNLSLTLVTGTAFAPLLKQVAADWTVSGSATLNVHAVVNTTLGETITVAGLLMGKDVATQLKDAELNEHVVLPAVMFRGPGGVTLDGMTPAEIGEALERSVTVATGMADLVANWRG